VAGLQTVIEGVTGAFPDIIYTVREMVAENDKVAVSWRFDGTQTGKYKDYAPTGKKVTTHGMAIFVLKDGKTISSETLVDRLGFLQGLGVLPANLQ
jgi:predicted ester cyclase